MKPELFISDTEPSCSNTMKPIPSDTGNFYGSTIRTETETDVGSGSSIPKQTFAIVEPSFNELRENGSRNGSGMKCFFKYNLVYPKNNKKSGITNLCASFCYKPVTR